MSETTPLTDKGTGRQICTCTEIPKRKHKNNVITTEFCILKLNGGAEVWRVPLKLSLSTLRVSFALFCWRNVISVVVWEGCQS